MNDLDICPLPQPLVVLPKGKYEWYVYKIEENMPSRALHKESHDTWAAMRARCYSPRAADFARYGGRGIGICNRWMFSFANFLTDMGDRPVGMSLERIDNNSHYTPGNCKWATPIEQMSNTSWNNRIMFQGKTQTVSQWARELGINRNTLSYRIHKGMTLDQALSLANEQGFGKDGDHAPSRDVHSSAHGTQGL